MVETKRIISLGIEKPSVLESDIIYVNFKAINESIVAEAISKEDFKCDYAFQTKQANNAIPSRNGCEYSGPHYFDYTEFLKELVKHNNGELTYSRLIKESAINATRMKDLVNKVLFIIEHH